MVSRLASTAVISIKRGGHRTLFGTNAIGEGIEITWGRQSLFAAPAKRSATVRLKIGTLSKMQAVFETMLRAELNITVDEQVVFVGHIDALKPWINRSEWWVELKAVEARGWNALLSKKFNTSAPTPALMRKSMEIQSGGIKPSVKEGADTDWPSLRFAPPNAYVSLTYEQGWSAVAAPYPLAWPSWSPDYATVMATTWQLNHRWNDTVIHSDQIACDEPIQEATELTQSYQFSSGGTYGEVREHSSVRSSGIGQPTSNDSREFKNPFAVTGYPSAMLSGVSLLIQAQITAPRTFTVYDDILMTSPQKIAAYFALFMPWERRTRFAISGAAPDDVVGLLWTHSTPRYTAIGGVLTINPQRSSHEMICIYTSPYRTA